MRVMVAQSRPDGNQEDPTEHKADQSIRADLPLELLAHRLSEPGHILLGTRYHC
jgi:hypothetical protein